MTKEEKNKSGAGKFFLGALVGTVAGLVASRFISVDLTKSDEEEDDEDEDFCDCEECECKKCDEKEEEADSKKSEAKAGKK